MKRSVLRSLAVMPAVAIFLAAASARAQFTTPFLWGEGLDKGTSVAKDSVADDVRLTSISSIATDLSTFGSAKFDLKSGKGDLWVYNFYSPSKRTIIGVGVLNLAALGFQGGGQPESIDTVQVAPTDTVLLDVSGQYSGGDKIYDRLKLDTAFQHFELEYPNFDPQNVSLFTPDPATTPPVLDLNQPVWTVIWTGGGDSSLVCFVGSKTGESICQRVQLGAGVPLDHGTKGTASLAVMPNPANEHTRVTVDMPSGAQANGADMALYNSRGQRMLDLTASFAKSGYQYADFDATTLPAGAYFCRVVGTNWNGITGVIIQK